MRFGNNSMNHAARDLRRDLRAVAEDTEALLEATKGESSRRIGQARERAQESLRRVRGNLDFARWQRPAQHAIRVGDEYVHHNPWRIVGVAAAVGVVIGWLLGLTRQQ
jgi:ElaB/YqjD/DUF883 family membrane-anchored ribosome-binding protein